MDHAIAAIARRMHAAGRITVLTGAGVSAASGVPTFRGAGGLWKSYSAQDLATPEAFQRDPKLVWEWYDWRRSLIARCHPNAAHGILARWSRRYDGFTLITQNVDGLHERAETRNVIRFHGSIREVLCWNGCKDSPPRWVCDTVPFPEIPPSCPYCGGLLRPGVVWFGEGIDPEVMRASRAALECEVFFAVGTSSQVYPAAGFMEEARVRGAFTVEINLEATSSSSRADVAIQGAAESILQEIEEKIALQ